MDWAYKPYEKKKQCNRQRLVPDSEASNSLILMLLSSRGKDASSSSNSCGDSDSRLCLLPTLGSVWNVPKLKRLSSASSRQMPSSSTRIPVIQIDGYTDITEVNLSVFVYRLFRQDFSPLIRWLYLRQHHT